MTLEAALAQYGPVSWGFFILAVLAGLKGGWSFYKDYSTWTRQQAQTEDEWYRKMIEAAVSQNGTMGQILQQVANSILVIAETQKQHTDCFSRIEGLLSKTTPKRRTDFSKDESHGKPTA